MRFSKILGVFLLAVTAACTGVQYVWVNPELGEREALADLRECRMLANDASWRMMWEMRWPPRFYNPRYMPPFYAAPMPFWYGFPMSIEREHALADFCMHSKGYHLEELPHSVNGVD